LFKKIGGQKIKKWFLKKSEGGKNVQEK